jgi:hypothetical protein
MKNLGGFILLLALLSACSNHSDKAAFVTYLGNDTLAVEQFEKTESGITARVILRSPSTTLSTYNVELDSTGGIASMQRTDFSLNDGFEGEGSVVQSIQRKGDSLMAEVSTDEGIRNYSAPYEPGVLPFIDMVHWPYELAFNRAVEMDRDTINQQLMTGDRLSTFVIADIEDDSMTIRHPSRGVMGVQVDAEGNIEMLDAARTTRKLQVKREQSVDINAIAKTFASDDQQGNPFGVLSGAEEADFTVQGADIHIEYGSPRKRGRELFGTIVPWNERWRTGANRATHFSTLADLEMGDLTIPAGEYTLFTIPEPDGGTLIVNKQTGQNGQSYDESRDLGRVPMQISEQESITEAFTITAEETGTGGVLKLIWGQTVFSVDFTVE